MRRSALVAVSDRVDRSLEREGVLARLPRRERGAPSGRRALAHCEALSARQRAAHVQPWLIQGPRQSVRVVRAAVGRHNMRMLRISVAPSRQGPRRFARRTKRWRWVLVEELGHCLQALVGTSALRMNAYSVRVISICEDKELARIEILHVGPCAQRSHVQGAAQDKIGADWSREELLPRHVRKGRAVVTAARRWHEEAQRGRRDACGHGRVAHRDGELTRFRGQAGTNEVHNSVQRRGCA